MRRLSQTEVAKGLGISFQQLQKYETGANRISASRLYEITGFFKVSPAHFFSGIGNEAKEASNTFDAGAIRLASYITSITDAKVKKRVKALVNELTR